MRTELDNSVNATGAHVPARARVRVRFDAITTLRFIAATLIVLAHSDDFFGVNLDEPAQLHLGVSFFFVLSGFVICYNYPRFESAGTLTTYLISRWARIWPLHAVTAMVWVATLNSFARIDGYGALLTNMALTQSWIPNNHYFLSLNGVAWTSLM